uniref:Uncharacterized protein n=1 Tax=Trichogramma kaykai TaxID=54128 RepID=A0ABD2WSI4_9HYME
MIFTASKMESSDIFNPTVRVKKEPREEPLNDNDYKIIDTTPVTQNIKYERFRLENSVCVDNYCIHHSLLKLSS